MHETRTLLLVKHAAPRVDPATPADRWPLSDAGREACPALAARLAGYDVQTVFSSEEPKAAETARLVAEGLGKPHRPAPGLHEHDRTGVPHLASRDFISAVALLFQKPAERVLGRETADEARRRFAAALDWCLAEQPGGALAVVTHGTVIALYLEAVAGVKPFQLWRRMGLPSFAALSLPEGRVVELVEHI